MIATKKILDETEKQIIINAKAGLTVKESANKIGITVPSHAARVREMKKYFNCNSMAQLCATIKTTKHLR